MVTLFPSHFGGYTEGALGNRRRIANYTVYLWVTTVQNSNWKVGAESNNQQLYRKCAKTIITIQLNNHNNSQGCLNTAILIIHVRITSEILLKNFILYVFKFSVSKVNYDKEI